MRPKSKAALGYALAPLVPFVIVVASLVALHIAPFGEHTLVVSDANALFVSDLSYFARLVRGQEGLLYSFESGIGMGQAGLVGILLNPVNFIVLLFDITDYAAMYTWVIAASVSLCGLTMYAFLARVRPASDLSNLIFSTAYALMGFNVAYCFLYSFLLQAALLPLIALGVRKILWGERPWFYVAVMAYTVLQNYYFGYMLVIAAAVLFLMWYAEEREALGSRRKQLWLTMILATACAGLLAAVTWLPSLLSIAGGRLEQNSIFDLTFDDTMGTLDVGAKLFAGAYSVDELVNGLPNVFVGALPVFLTVAYFLDSRVGARSKLCRAVPIAFYLTTFWVRALNMAMQGFSTTNWFNHRYSFVFSFLVLLVAAEEWPRLRDLPRRDLLRALAAYALLAVAVFSRQRAFVHAGSVLLAAGVLGLTLASVEWGRRDPTKAPAAQVAILALLLCSGELYANFCMTQHAVQDWSVDTAKYQEDLFYDSVYADVFNAAGEGLYRSANENPSSSRCDNDPRLFGYAGTSYFGSQERTFVFKGMSRLGMPWFSNRMWYAPGLPASLDSLIGVRYVVSRGDLASEKGYAFATASDRDKVYENPLALPVGMLSSAGELLPELGTDPFANMNALWHTLAGGEEDVFVEEDGLTFTYHESADGETFAYQDALAYSASFEESASQSQAGGSPSSAGLADASGQEGEEAGRPGEAADESSPRYIEVAFTARRDGPVYSYRGMAVDPGSGYDKEPLRYLGEFKAGDVVTDRVAISGATVEFTRELLEGECAQYRVAYEDRDVLSRYARQLQERSGTLEKVTDDCLVGEVDAAQAGRLFFTIPYDQGWTLAVDGSEVPLEADAGLFMSAPLPAGRHTYEMRFVPRGLREGALASVAGVALLLLLALLDSRWRKRAALAQVVVDETSAYNDSRAEGSPDHFSADGGSKPDVAIPSNPVDTSADVPGPAGGDAV